MSNAELEQLVTEKTLKNIGRYKNYWSYRQSLIAYSTLYAVTMKLRNYSLEKLSIEGNEWGKPRFLDIPDYFFNISHSKDWVVLAISSREIGIDVEYNEIFDYCEVVETFFSEKEKNIFFNTSTKEQLKLFYKLWTLKESYIKAVGKGMTMALNSFNIEILENPITINNDIRFEMIELFLDYDYTLSVCYQIGDKVESLSVLQLEKIAEIYK